MIVEKNKVVSLSYELKVAGDTVETVDADSPLTFMVGTGNLLPKFEEQLTGLKANNEFNFELKSDDAYGPASEEAIVEVPLQAFEVDGKVDTELLKVGNNIPMLDNSGNHLNGKVLSIGIENVSMDFNHPLAGNDLNFTGTILEIRDATADELEHGHIHSANSCGNCNDSNCHSKSC